jgi:dTDP-4-dehydrorhamnose reductase
MNRKRLLVTGCGGFVGGAIVHQAGADWELHAVTRGRRPIERDGLDWHVLDLTDGDRLDVMLDEVRPDVVIHAAAVANIDYCEANRDVALLVNVAVTNRLAEWCADHRARTIYISTDNVFDGVKGNYTEEEPPSPLNVYAESKAEAESIVASIPEQWVVVRPSVVMGLPMLGAGNSFLSWMITALEAGKEVFVPDNEIRSTIDVVTLARALLELASHEYTGYIHLAGNDILNRYEMVRRIAVQLGLPPNLVVARNPDWIPGRAPRPLNASLCNRKAKLILRTPMRGVEDGLALVLSERKAK